MNRVEQSAAAKAFIEKWNGKGDEKQDAQSFWLELLSEVLDIKKPTDYISFEKTVKIDGHTKYIDGYIADTKVLIEQKGINIDLEKPYLQSGGEMATPFQQARNYANYLPHDEHPRWIITCNFKEFHIHDMNRPNEAPEILYLKDLEKEVHRLQFLVNQKDENIRREMEVSMKAGEIVGVLYDKIKEQYPEPDAEETLKSLNVLCVRLVFCLYAEDAGIFGRKNMFCDYVADFEAKYLRRAFIDLFKVLDTDLMDRDRNLEEELAEFPYVNGGLFADENIEIPQFTEEIKSILLNEASKEFDWSEISPTIFGAVFESTLNPETRRSGGMHYTSIENIHKVIDPLFLNELEDELAEIKQIAVNKTKLDKLDSFQTKIAELKFLDPACGSGNFLTESYLSLRKMENEIIAAKIAATKGQITGQVVIGGLNQEANPIRVSIGQFYGIEINDFACTVAKTALWIAESQMMKKTEDIIHMALDFLPLKAYANIVEGNALQLDWESIIPKKKLDYIMGNPPFVGNVQMSVEQKNDMSKIFSNKEGRLDYVSAWYVKAADYIQETQIECAFVSTNSITQGIQVPTLWGFIQEHFSLYINFAYKTFSWNSEAKSTAAVHCVIIGFAAYSRKNKILYEGATRKERLLGISYYLTEGSNTIIYGLNNPIHSIPRMVRGNQPSDGGWLILNVNEYNEFKEKEPQALKYIKRFMMGKEFINNIERYCLWLVDASPKELLSMPMVMKRVEMCKQSRLNAPAKLTQSFAETPTLFGQRAANFDGNYIALGRVSSQNRRYIPMDFLTQDVIAGDKLYIIPNGTIFMFGILMSNVHNAWMRMFSGRMKSDYSYSTKMVYNTFPWPNPTDEQKAAIEQTAQAILDARKLYPDCSLADMYGEKMYLFTDLLKAHQANDRAVLQAYGFPTSAAKFGEADCVAKLMKLYQEKTMPGKN